VARAEAGVGWRIWDNQQRKFWGQLYDQHPKQLIDELNDQKRPEVLVELGKTTKTRKPK
jgi:hypothetical protein